MGGRRIGLVAASLALAFGVYLIWLRPAPTAEDRVRQQIVQMERKAEARDVAFLVSQLSSRFLANGQWTRDASRAVLEHTLSGEHWLRVFVVDVDVQATGPQTVRATVKILFSRSDARRLKDLVRDSITSAYAIEAVAQREADGEWRFLSAKVTPIDGRLLL